MSVIDVRAVGIAIVNLGGGRAREDDVVDHSVGLTEVAALGERVDPGARPLALVPRVTRTARAAPRTRSAPRSCSETRLARSPVRWPRFSARCRRRSRRRGSPSRRRCARARCRVLVVAESLQRVGEVVARGPPSSRRARSLTYTRSIDGEHPPFAGPWYMSEVPRKEPFSTTDGQVLSDRGQVARA